MEKETRATLYDHRLKRFIKLSDISYVEKACKILGDIKFEVLNLENEIYATNGDNFIFVPKGLVWIKLRTDLPAGQGFDFVFKKTEQLKQESIKSKQ